MGHLQKLVIECGILLVRTGILGKRILLFSIKGFGKTLLWLAKRIAKRPLVSVYKIHLKFQSRLERLGVDVNNRFFYFFSSKTLTHALILVIGFGSVIANVRDKESPPDILNPRNILSRVIPRGDDEVIEEDIAAASPSEQEYISLTGVKSPLAFASEGEEVHQNPGLGQIAFNPGALIKPTLPTTAQRVDEPAALRTYVVQPGDTIGQIAGKFGLKLTTILWTNDLSERSTLRVGQRLVILPKDGILYRVRRGDTLEKIAHSFQSTVDKIVATNSLPSDRLAVGASLIIPDGVRVDTPARNQEKNLIARIKNIFIPPQIKKNVGSALSGVTAMLWPTTARRITQYFSWRHTGVDIAGPPSNKILAASNGTVVLSGWQRGYGNTVIIDHGNGRRTRYAHASRLFVKRGEKVVRGETIAMVGSTGRSTGPHLHFEVYVGNRRVNPLTFVR